MPTPKSERWHGARQSAACRGVWGGESPAIERRVRLRPLSDSRPLDRVLLVTRHAPGSPQSANPEAKANRAATSELVAGADLAASLAARGGQLVHATSNVTDALRLAITRRTEFDTVVVALRGVDRFADEWAGPRLPQRLLDRSIVHVAIAVDPRDRDGAAYAQRVGVDDLVLPASARSGAAAPATTSAAVPHPLAHPTRAETDRLAAWFAAHFDGTWQPWMPDAAAAIATGTDRSEQVAWCQARWNLDAADATRRRIRDFRGLLSGEIRDDTALERRAALDVLALCGTVAPIDIDPDAVRSLQRAATTIRRRPHLVRDLVVPQELADLLEVAEAEATLSGREAGGPGRPPVGAWRWRRDQALGRVAASRAPTAASKQLLHEALRAGLQATLLLVHDALTDAAALDCSAVEDPGALSPYLEPASGHSHDAAGPSVLRSGASVRRPRSAHRRP